VNHYPRLTYINKIILIATLSLFLVSSILRAVGAFSLVQFLGLSGGGLLSGYLWQIITYPLIETQLLSFLFNALLIWFVGSEMEELWGKKLYLRFIILVTLFTGLFFTLIEFTFFFGTQAFFTPLSGLTGINIALLIAYSILYPDRQLSMMMIFPMRAKVFCWILVGIEAYMAIFSAQVTSWAHLLAMGTSFLLIKYQNLRLVHHLLNFQFRAISKKKTTKKHLYIVNPDNDDSKPPKYWQ
jgi:membrane associated rhomboid family serine protease